MAKAVIVLFAALALLLPAAYAAVPAQKPGHHQRHRRHCRRQHGKRHKRCRVHRKRHRHRHYVRPPATAPAPAPPPAPAPAPVPAPPSGDAAVPCRGSAPPAGGYRHVVWIIEENESQSAISASNAPYMTALGQRCGLTTNLKAVTHPSLPNYLALTSGSTQGVTDDASPASHPLSASSIFSQLGENWTSLEDAMPSPCGLASSGTYAVKHNPAAYFTNVRPACGTRDLAFSSSQTPDVSRAFTLIAPDLCNDMHDCPVATGDAWLSAVVPKILDSATYHGGDTLLVITFDEGSGSDQTVWTAVVAPSVPPGMTSSASFTHYSTLRTTEELLGLPLLGAASSAQSFAADFHLR